MRPVRSIRLHDRTAEPSRPPARRYERTVCPATTLEDLLAKVIAGATLSVEETALWLGLPPQTVRDAERRARRKIAAAFAERHPTQLAEALA